MKKLNQTKKELKQSPILWKGNSMEEMDALRRLDAAHNAYKLAEEGWGKNYWAEVIARLNNKRKLS
jgi:hypothetical protein